MMFDFRSANSIRDATRRARYRSAVLIALLVGIAVFSAACYPYEDVGGTVENRTDSAVCFYHHPEDAAEGACSGELKPHTTDDWFTECGDGPGADKIPITVILAVKEGDRVIYQRTEECGAWQKSDGKFVIEQRGDDFIVTDYIAATTPSP
jgi:hypothetical protein